MVVRILATGRQTLLGKATEEPTIMPGDPSGLFWRMQGHVVLSDSIIDTSCRLALSSWSLTMNTRTFGWSTPIVENLPISRYIAASGKNVPSHLHQGELWWLRCSDGWISKKEATSWLILYASQMTWRSYRQMYTNWILFQLVSTVTANGRMWKLTWAKQKSQAMTTNSYALLISAFFNSEMASLRCNAVGPN